MDATQQVTMVMSFVAGLMSFVSPCVLPIVPSFLGFISGMSLEEMAGPQAKRSSVIFYTLWFVLGFSVVFIALGASATWVGGLLLKYQTLLRWVGGFFIIVLGLQFMGLFQIGFLQNDKRLHLQSRPLGAAGSFLVGVTFGLGWTPCIGPILGSILMVAASEASMTKGITMLAAYSLGFAIPFLVAAAALSAFMSTYRRYARFIPKVLFASGLLLVVIGLLLMTNRFAVVSEYLMGVCSR